MFISFDRSHERGREADRQTPRYGVGCIASQGKSNFMHTCWRALKPDAKSISWKPFYP